MSQQDSLVHSFYKVAVYTALRPLRNLIYKQVSKTKISQTEKDALEAGDSGFEADILNGKPDWENNLLNLKMPGLTKEEQDFLDGPVEELCYKLDDWAIRNSATADLPEDVWQYIKDNKFLGMVIPKKYGGLEFSALAHSEVLMKLSSRNTGATVTVMVPNSLGSAELIAHDGTEEQKDYFLNRLANGVEISCFALTEVNAGSDAGSMQSTGIVCKNEKGEIGIRLNINDKRYATLAPIATLIGATFKLKDPDGILTDKNDPTYKEDVGITIALVPRDTKGLEIGRRHIPLDMAFHNGTVSSKDSFIPIDNIIGGRKFAGKGWGAMIMKSLAVGRSISLPGSSTGVAKFATLMSATYARVRKQFGMPISDFEAINSEVGGMAGLTYRMNAARVTTAQMVDNGLKPSVLGAVLKYHLTEDMRKTINNAMDIHGGKGISLGPRNYLASMYQAAPIPITVEGANKLTRGMIIFNQASMRSHNFLRDETEAAIGKDMEEFSDLMAKHVRQGTNNGVRTAWLGITNAFFDKAPVKGAGEEYYRHINRLSSALATMADITYLVVGGAMKSKQKITERLGDALSNLYLASATLRYFESNGAKKEEEPMMRWACEHSLAETEKALDELIDNYPFADLTIKTKNIKIPFTNIRILPETIKIPFTDREISLETIKIPFLRVPLTALIFPLSAIPFVSKRRFNGPSDSLTHKVAGSILKPGPARDEIAKGIFIPEGEKEHVAEVMQAFDDAIKAAPIEEKIVAAIKNKYKKDVSILKKIFATNADDRLEEAVEKGIIQRYDIETIKKAEASRDIAVRVDDFSNDLRELRPQ